MRKLFTLECVTQLACATILSQHQLRIRATPAPTRPTSRCVIWCRPRRSSRTWKQRSRITQARYSHRRPETTRP